MAHPSIELMKLTRFCAAAAAVGLVGCGGGKDQSPVESKSAASKFVNALLRYDAGRARSLVDPRSGPDDALIEGMIATLKR